MQFAYRGENSPKNASFLGSAGQFSDEGTESLCSFWTDFLIRLPGNRCSFSRLGGL